VTTTHRAATGQTYNGIPIHAARGVHEHCLRIVQQRCYQGAKVLDVGAGSGALSSRLIAAGFDVEAADVDPSDIAVNCRSHAWDASSMNLQPLTEGTFDAVCAVEMLEHIENPLQALRNMRALLKPSGVLVVSTPNTTHPRSRIKFLLKGAPSYFGENEYTGSGHRTILTDWLLAQHLRSVGFDRLERSYAGSLGLTGVEAWVYRMVAPIFAVARWMPSPRSEDGACVFFTSTL
jgi:SAM-dependent methyltransferase